MRVLLLTDMEGVSTITDTRECWPVFPEYWRTGRAKMTAEVVAVTTGLLQGGATAVLIQDRHGTGWPNLLPDALPEGVTTYRPTGAESRVDAMFQLGLHARCGTADGFISHTHVPEFRLRVNGTLITETHDYAWRSGLPLLGITGDATLQRELDGELAGVPFLGVKHSSSRVETRPVHDDPHEELRAFARRCLVTRRAVLTPHPPEQFTVEISMRPDLADLVHAGKRLTRTGDGVFSLTGTDWQRDARPGIAAATIAALRPWRAAHGDLDLSSEESMLRQDPESLSRLRAYIESWMQTNYSAW